MNFLLRVLLAILAFVVTGFVLALVGVEGTIATLVSIVVAIIVFLKGDGLVS